jgi:hypothetical protein
MEIFAGFYMRPQLSPYIALQGTTERHEIGFFRDLVPESKVVVARFALKTSALFALDVFEQEQTRTELYAARW